MNYSANPILKQIVVAVLCWFVNLLSYSCWCCLSSCAVAGAAGIVSVLTGPSGLKSIHEGDRTAASLSLGSCMAVAPSPVFEALLPALEQLLDRKEHDGLTEEQITIWRTPEGMLSTDVVPEGVYVPQVVANKNVRKARGRMRVSAGDKQDKGWCYQV